MAPFRNARSGCAGSLEQSQGRINVEGILLQGCQIAVYIRKQVDFVNDQNGSLAKHSGIFKGFVIPFCGTDHNDFEPFT
jgi:hypothetical protein